MVAGQQTDLIAHQRVPRTRRKNPRGVAGTTLAPLSQPPDVSHWLRWVCVLVRPGIPLRAIPPAVLAPGYGFTIWKMTTSTTSLSSRWG